MMNTANTERSRSYLNSQRYIERANKQGLYQRVMGFSSSHLKAINDFASLNGYSSIGEALSGMIDDYREMTSYISEASIRSVKVSKDSPKSMTSFYMGDKDFDYLRSLSRRCGFRVSAATGAALLIESLSEAGLL